jgi:Domain of unknown function (DUF4345)
VDDPSPSDGGRRALQVVLAVLATIPFARGAVDILAGSDLLPGGASYTTASLDSEFRFASTFWLAVGPVVWSQVPRVASDSPVLPLTWAPCLSAASADARIRCLSELSHWNLSACRSS